MLILKIRHHWPEAADFRLIRPRGNEGYTIFLFHTAVNLEFSGTAVPLKPGGCIIYPPNTAQYVSAQGPLLYSFIHITEDSAAFLRQFKLPLGQPFYPRDTEVLTNLLEKMEPEFFSQNPYREEMLDAMFRALLITLSRSAQESSPVVQLKQEKHLDIKEIRQHVLSNPQRKWTVAEMAKMMSLSPSRFHAVYKDVFGTAPMHDVIEAKIEYAKSLLLSNKRYSLPQVAEMLGYNDQYHFIRQFRIETGMTPGAFRKKNQ